MIDEFRKYILRADISKGNGSGLSRELKSVQQLLEHVLESWQNIETADAKRIREMERTLFRLSSPGEWEDSPLVAILEEKKFQIEPEPPQEKGPTPRVSQWGEKTKKKQEKKERLERRAAILDEFRSAIGKNNNDSEVESPESEELYELALRSAEGLQRGTIAWAGAIMGLIPSTSFENAKARFYERARMWHPDLYRQRPVREQDRIHEAMIALNEAWDIFREKSSKGTL
jgi:hypothetical protein